MPHRAVIRVARSHPLNMLAVLVGFVLAVGAVFQVYETAEQTHKAICALRSERIRGIQSARAYLHDHPNGTQDFSRSDILRSIEAQKETVRAFRFADC